MTTNSYEELFTALRHNLNITTSIDLCLLKFDSCRQNSDTVQTYNQRFRQCVNELNYTILAEHSNNTARRIALHIEEKSAIKKYIMNLREEIGSQAKPLKPDSIQKAQQEASETET